MFYLKMRSRTFCFSLTFGVFIIIAMPPACTVVCYCSMHSLLSLFLVHQNKLDEVINMCVIN